MTTTFAPIGVSLRKDIPYAISRLSETKYTIVMSSFVTLLDRFSNSGDEGRYADSASQTQARSRSVDDEITAQMRKRDVVTRLQIAQALFVRTGWLVEFHTDSYMLIAR
jgi:hypothetical protein